MPRTPRGIMPQAGIAARWPGTCCICKQDFPKDTRIAKVRGLPCHVECHMSTHE